MKTFKLVITTWAGTVEGARHYYGRLWNWNGEYITDVYHNISQIEANLLNKDNFRDGYPATYEQGNESGQFFCKEDVVTAAIQEFQKLDGHALLAYGNRYDEMPTEIIVAPSQEWVDKVNSLCIMYEEARNNNEFNRAIEINKEFKELCQ